MTDKKINFVDYEIVKFLKNAIIENIESDNYFNTRDYSIILATLKRLYNISDKIKTFPKDFYKFCDVELDNNIYLLNNFINSLDLKIEE